MILHKVKVYPSKINLPRKKQLAWKIAEVASDNAKLNKNAVEMVINRIIDNASVAIASLNRKAVVSSREMALKHPRKNGATLFGINSKLKFDCEWAAWSNGTAVRELDFHDTFLAADYSHPGDNIPPLLSVAQQKKKNGLDLLKGIITAIPKIRNEKKAKMIMDKIKGRSIDDISSSQNQTIQTALAVNMKNPVLSGTGNEPNVVGYAFGIDEGVTSKGIIGNKGVFYVKVDRIKYANVMSSYQNYTNLLNSITLGSYNSKVYEALLESAEIEDNRFLFY